MSLKILYSLIEAVSWCSGGGFGCGFFGCVFLLRLSPRKETLDLTKQFKQMKRKTFVAFCMFQKRNRLQNATKDIVLTTSWKLRPLRHYGHCAHNGITDIALIDTLWTLCPLWHHGHCDIMGIAPTMTARTLRPLRHYGHCAHYVITDIATLWALHPLWHHGNCDYCDIMDSVPIIRHHCHCACYYDIIDIVSTSQTLCPLQHYGLRAYYTTVAASRDFFVIF